MGKIKNQKSNLAHNYDKFKKHSMKKTLTPFEIHINKNKQNVLGRKSKTDQGLPGIARTKAITKRKHTLLIEYKVKDKDNIFLDRRIGEKSSGMVEEDKVIARFATERVIAYKKKNIFNLNNEEILTHKGQSLIDIEKYDNLSSNEDDYSDDDNKTGKLEKKFVGDAHFGGGILSKLNLEMSRKDVIDQLILESKKRKAERQKIKEQTIDLTKKLDSEWHDLLPFVSSSNTVTEIIEEKSKANDYDIALKKLKYEARGKPTDKLKSEEIIIKEKKNVLKNLEENRLARMKGFSDEAEFEKKHRSADDLDDIQIESVENDSFYNENNQEKIILIKLDNKSIKYKNNKESNIDNKNSNPNESLDNETDQDNDESEVESSNNFSDLKVTDSSDTDGKIENGNIKNVKEIEVKNGEIPKKNNIKEIEDFKIDINMINRETILEKARQELPYSFKTPLTYKELLILMKDYNPDYQSVIIERIIKYNLFKLANKNKEILSNLFSLLLQYLNKSAFVNNLKELINFFKVFNMLCPHLYDLTLAYPNATKNCLSGVLKDKHNKFENKIKTYPKLDTLILFKLVSILYPTSDFRHPIVTPCLVFMSQILFRCKIKGKHDISKGLFLSTLILEYTILSKRWAPSVINFLRGIIFISLPKPFSKSIKVLPPFKTIHKNSDLLVLEKNQKNLDIDPASIKMQIEDLCIEEINDNYRLRTFITAINLLHEFQEQCKEIDAAYIIFEPILTLLKFGSVKKYPKKIKEKVQNLIYDLEKLKNKKLEYLMFHKKIPKALKMYEPRIEAVYDGKKHKPMCKATVEKEKLLHKLKKETKSAIREVRRDNVFLSKVKIKQQIASDIERKRKVKEIFNNAAIQQSELKKLKKK